MEYYNVCGNDSFEITAHVPDYIYFYGYPSFRQGDGGRTFVLRYPPAIPYWPFNYRDNLVGRLYHNLTTGKTYCVSFWTIMAESSGYAHNKIGAYLDDGSINKVDSFGEEKSDLKPQVFTNTVLIDTFNWTKVEGSFTATGTEKYITVGNFFPNDSVTTIATDYRKFLPQHSCYLIDDVSVIPIDLDAYAGKDSHAEPGKPVQIGRLGDTTAMGLDGKWYYKEALIDSGAVISVMGSSIVGTKDTYVVVQTICGLSQSDTVTVTTVPLGLPPATAGAKAGFKVYPNPSNGVLAITSTAVIPGGGLPAGRQESVNTVVYDLLGRVVQRKALDFTNGTAILNVKAAPGVYIVALAEGEYNVTHQRIVIE